MSSTSRVLLLLTIIGCGSAAATEEQAAPSPSEEPLGDPFDVPIHDATPEQIAALVGLRFSKNFMHDSRAHSIGEAILTHDGPGSQANASVARYRALAEPDLAALVAFVGSL